MNNTIFSRCTLTMTMTKREVEILHLISLGLTDIEIGKQIFLSHYTVSDHRRNIQVKLKSRNAASSVRQGYELGLLPLERQEPAWKIAE